MHVDLAVEMVGSLDLLSTYRLASEITFIMVFVGRTELWTDAIGLSNAGGAIRNILVLNVSSKTIILRALRTPILKY